jgi:lipid-binding SYLF domain-containing protein
MLRHPLATWGLITVFTVAPAVSAPGRTEDATIRAAGEVLAQFLDLHIKEIPASLLAEAHGVAIIPDVIKLGFVLGGQRGKGIVIIREKDGSWRAPLFVTITGGSVGWQVGAQSTDFVLVFKTQKSVEGLLRGKFTLGADVAIAAGPVGRRAGAATDTELKAEIYSYSRSRGLFAGVSLEGSALQVDHEANAAFYGAAQPSGQPPAVPEAALKLVENVAKLTNPAVAGNVVAGGNEARGANPVNLPARRLTDVDALQAELVQAAKSLSPLLDDSWGRYLALPAEIFQPGRGPAPEAIQAALAHFDAVARDAQFRTLSERPEFQSAYRSLRSYAEAISGLTSRLALPPPPGLQPSGVPR